MTRRIESRMVAGPVEFIAYRDPIEGTDKMSTLRFRLSVSGTTAIDVGVEAAKLFSRLVNDVLKREKPEYHPEWTLTGSHAKAYAAFRSRSVTS